MQPNKNTKKVEQIEKVSQSEEAIAYNIKTVISKFGIKSILNPLDVLKRSGALVSTIAITLIILPFITKGSVLSLFTNNLDKEDEGKKDSFYGLKNNPKINWRALLYGIAKRFIILVSAYKDEKTNQIRALIFDDTPTAKTGKKIERVGYVHDHVSGTYILGFKVLVSGYWDGVSFIPIDFSIHREKRDGEILKSRQRLEKKRKQIKKLKEYIRQLTNKINNVQKARKQLKKACKTNISKTKQKQLEAKTKTLKRLQDKLGSTQQAIEQQKEKLLFLENNYQEQKSQAGKCGLKPHEYSNQFKKQRPKETPGHKRIKETDLNKIDSAISMIKRALRNGFRFEYVLTDSWFFCGKLLQFINSLGKSIHLVSMARLGNTKYKLLPENKYYPAKKILELKNRGAKSNRRYKAKYIKLQAEYQGVRVVLFFVSIGKGNNWRLLVSTDLSISFNKLMEVYKIRWAIEVFFKEAKQHLLFGKSPSRDFDAQIADVTLSFMRYILLTFYSRTHYEISIGALFEKMSQASVEENLVADLSQIFMDLLISFAELAGIDFLTMFEDLILLPQNQKSLERLNLFSTNKAA